MNLTLAKVWAIICMIFWNIKRVAIHKYVVSNVILQYYDEPYSHLLFTLILKKSIHI